VIETIKKLVLFALLFFALGNIAYAAENPLEQILEPMRGFNIAEAYAVHSHFIDFVIYLFIFIAIAKLTIGERFKGRQSNILAGVIGVTLAVSLAVAEQRLGFSIRSFGVIAAFIIVLFAGYVFYKVIYHISGGRVGSSSIAVVTVYLLIKAVNPLLFNWLADNAPFIHFVLGIAVIISIWHIFSLFIRRPNKSLNNIRVKTPEVFKKVTNTVREFMTEGEIIKARLEIITKKERKQSAEIIAELKEILDIIDEHGRSSYACKLIVEKLQDIIPREHDLVNKLVYLKNLNEELKKFDFSKFKELKEKYARASKEGKKLIKKEILEQREKIHIEQKIDDLDLEIKKYEEEFRYYLNMAVNYLRAGKLEETKKWVYEIIECESKTGSLLKKIQVLEDIILKLTKIEVKQELKSK